MIGRYNITNWYWVVADGPPNQVYSSASAAYVPLTQPAYVAWLAAGYTPTKIATTTSLAALLMQNYTPGSIGVNAVAKSASFDAQLATILAGGFVYDFSAYSTSTGVAMSTLNPHGTAGHLTLQMDDSSQINWLGVVTQAQFLIAAGTPTQTLQIRLEENVNAVLPATAVVTLLAAAAAWKTTLVFTCAGLKDQLAALSTDPTVYPAQMAAITWPAS